MKKKIILNCLSPSHIAWLLSGVLLAEGTNWLLYKDIKRVTAPGLSSLVAVCALVLAIYSAFQVKKWLGNKVNEKGFKKCEEIIDQLSEISIGLTYINIKLSYVLEMNKRIEISQQEFKADLDTLYHDTYQEIENYIDIALKTYVLQKELYVWNFKMNPKFDTWNIHQNTVNYSNALNTFYFAIVHNDYKLEYDMAELQKTYVELIKSIKPFHRNSFNDIFTVLPSNK